MPLELDHVVIAVHDLDTAVQDYRALGFTVLYGGTHANRATCNALVTFANGTYLELLAATGETPRSGLVDFSRMLHHGEGLAGFALRATDLDAEVARLQAEGFAVGAVIPGERRREDGTLVQWKLALLDDGFAPFLIQDVTPQARRISTDPAVTTHANGAVGLQRVEVAVSDLPSARERYERLLDRELAANDWSADVIVREDRTLDRAEALSALHLHLAPPERGNFPVRLVHGVRFQLSTI